MRIASNLRKATGNWRLPSNDHKKCSNSEIGNWKLHNFKGSREKGRQWSLRGAISAAESAWKQNYTESREPDRRPAWRRSEAARMDHSSSGAIICDALLLLRRDEGLKRPESDPMQKGPYRDQRKRRAPIDPNHEACKQPSHCTRTRAQRMAMTSARYYLHRRTGTSWPFKARAAKIGWPAAHHTPQHWIQSIPIEQ